MCSDRRLVRMSQVQSEPLRWVWPGYIAEGAITDFSGDPGQGKSCIAYDLAARLTSGRAMPGCTDNGPAAGVVLLQGEDNVSMKVRPALEAMGADLDKISVYDPKEFRGKPLVLPRDLDLVREAVAEVRAKLVVLDPATTFTDCNPNSERSVRQALRLLAQFAEKERLAVLLVRHLNKRGGWNALHQAAGSMAWSAMARTALRAISDASSGDPHRHLLFTVKSNLASAPSLAYRTILVDGQIVVEWTGTSDVTVRDLICGEHDDRSKVREAVEILFLILRNGERPVQDILKKAREGGVARRTLERAKLLLNVKSFRSNFKYGTWYWLWKLPDDGNSMIANLQQKYAALDAVADEHGTTPKIVELTQRM